MSGETEVKKDLEWLKNKLREIREKNDKGNNFEGAASMNLALRLISELDEPEVLSQEWIDENKTSIDRKLDGTPIYKVREELLQNLLVPKQEEITHKQVEKYLLDKNIRVIDIDIYEEMQSDLAEIENKIVIEKPVIPKFVAEHIENRRGESLARAYNVPIITKVGQWLLDKKNCETFARAWLDGYRVKKEQKYYVRENNYLLCKWKNEVMDYVEAVGREITDLVELKLTEQEIKDYDERYWAFAVKVEELEE